MKWCILITLVLLTASPAWAETSTQPGGKVVVYFFWSTGCPHCKEEKEFLRRLSLKHPQLEIRDFEVKGKPENAELFSRMAEAHGVVLKGVPATFIGGLDPVIGYTGYNTTGREIEEKVETCLQGGCSDPSERLKQPGRPLTLAPPGPLMQEEGLCEEDVECPEEEADGGAGPPEERPGGQEKAEDPLSEGGKTAGLPRSAVDAVRIPFLGEVELSGMSLPLQTVIIAGLDGFNPCAFFVLFTLLGLMVHARSRRRVLLIGGIFVFFSGLFYFLFMAAWLNVFLLTGQIAAVTTAAGVVALVIAAVNMKDFFYFGRGISLMIPEKAKPGLFERMRGLMAASSLPSVVAGTVVLAAAANTYELFCTAGFPMVYTRILTLYGLSKAYYYLYITLYNVIYVLPLSVIVLVFAMTLGSKKMTQWQGRVLKLVSGMMMLGLGLVLLIEPDLFNNPAVTAGLLGAAIAGSALIALLTSRQTKKPSAL